jgi:hypothetical protein
MTSLNDDERRSWVLNDEGLHSWWVKSGMGIYKFVKENREEIDVAIRSVLERKPKR